MILYGIEGFQKIKIHESLLTMQNRTTLFVRITYPILIVFVFILLLLLHFSFEDYKVKAYQVNTITSGLSLVKAIEKYHMATGVFPDSLESLVPEYIPFMYPAHWGNTGWIYEKNSDGFTLQVGYGNSVDGHLYPQMLYSSEEDYWSFND